MKHIISDMSSDTQCSKRSSSKISSPSGLQLASACENNSMEKNKKCHWVKKDIVTSEGKKFELLEWLQECDG